MRHADGYGWDIIIFCVILATTLLSIERFFFLLFSFSGAVLGPNSWLLIYGEKIKEETKVTWFTRWERSWTGNFIFGLRWKPGRSTAPQIPRRLNMSTGWHHTHLHRDKKYLPLWQLPTLHSEILKVVDIQTLAQTFIRWHTHARARRGWWTRSCWCRLVGHILHVPLTLRMV